MSNLLAGSLVTAFCAGAYFWSWRFAAKDNYRIALILLVAAGLILRVFTAADGYLHTWDEQFHALVAKNLLNHPLIPTLYDQPVLEYDFRNWTSNHFWLHKQPLALMIMALSLKLFGVSEFALRIPSILVTTLGIWLTFDIGRRLFSRKTGYLAALLFSMHGLIVEMTGGRVATDHIDIFFLFFIELAVWFCILFAQKGKILFNILCGISIGAAILTKWLPALIVLPVWILVTLDTGKYTVKSLILHFALLLGIIVLIALPWQIYIFQTFPAEAAWESSFNLRHLTEVIEGRTGPVYYFLDRIRITYGELIYLPVAWFLWITLKNRKNGKLMAISIWFLVPFLFFSLVKTKMQAYLLFTSPAIFLMSAEFFQATLRIRERSRYKWIFSLVLILLIALPARYTIERVKPFSDDERRPEWVAQLKSLGEKQYAKGLLFNYDQPVAAMFYTGLTVYPDMPDAEKIRDFIAKGYTILMNEGDDVPPGITQMSGVVVVHLQVPGS